MLDQLQRSEGHRNEENKLSRDKRYQVSARGDGDLEEWGLRCSATDNEGCRQNDVWEEVKVKGW
jgi:hypothetical protein